MCARLTRRRFLASGGLAALAAVAGCQVQTGKMTDFQINNEMAGDVQATLKVFDKDGGEKLLEATRTVPAGESDENYVIFADVVDSDGVYIVTVELADGRSATDEWDATFERREGIDIYLYEDRVDFRLVSF